MFSMQPTVIPVGLTFGWFVITILFLTGAMFVIQWLVMQWNSLRNQFFLWMNLEKLEQRHGEGTSNSRETEFETDVVPEFDRDGGGIELHSLVTWILSRRGTVSPV